MEFVRFLFESFWHFAGFFICLMVVCVTLSDIAESFKRKKE